MENKELTERIRQKKFFRNNGMVLKGINILHTKYVKLTELSYGLEPSMSESELLDSINYLTEGGYIKTRHFRTKQEVTLADCSFDELEAKVSHEGIQIITCTRTDPCIDV